MDATTGVLRMADVVGGLSLVADAGFGLPAEESMRSCLVASALARRLGLSESDVSDVFYTALLEHVGCTGTAHEAAEVYGDELGLYEVAVVTDDSLRDELSRCCRSCFAAGPGRSECASWLSP